MYGLDESHRKFSNTPKDKYQYQWALIQSTKNTSQQSTKEIFIYDLERYFGYKKSIGMNKYEQSTGNLDKK